MPSAGRGGQPGEEGGGWGDGGWGGGSIFGFFSSIGSKIRRVFLGVVTGRVIERWCGREGGSESLFVVSGNG